jgi:hypothetical protein
MGRIRDMGESGTWENPGHDTHSLAVGRSAGGIGIMSPYFLPIFSYFSSFLLGYGLFEESFA